MRVRLFGAPFVHENLNVVDDSDDAGVLNRLVIGIPPLYDDIYINPANPMASQIDYKPNLLLELVLPRLSNFEIDGGVVFP